MASCARPQRPAGSLLAGGPGSCTGSTSLPSRSGRGRPARCSATPRYGCVGRAQAAQLACVNPSAPIRAGGHDQEQVHRGQPDQHGHRDQAEGHPRPGGPGRRGRAGAPLRPPAQAQREVRGRGRSTLGCAYATWPTRSAPSTSPSTAPSGPQVLARRMLLWSASCRAVSDVDPGCARAGVVLVTFKSHIMSMPPYRIENQCADVYIYFVQACLAVFFNVRWNWVLYSLCVGGSVIAYAWDEPTEEHRLRVKGGARFPVLPEGCSKRAGKQARIICCGAGARGRQDGGAHPGGVQPGPPGHQAGAAAAHRQEGRQRRRAPGPQRRPHGAAGARRLPAGQRVLAQGECTLGTAHSCSGPSVLYMRGVQDRIADRCAARRCTSQCLRTGLRACCALRTCRTRAWRRPSRACWTWPRA